LQFDPSKFFVGALEFFGALLPGAIILYVGRFVAISAGMIENGTWPNKTIDWVLFVVGSLVLGYLAQPPAHVLNKLYDRTYRARKRWQGDPLLAYARQEAESHVGPEDSVYVWAKSEVGYASAQQLARIDRIEGISKMFRTLAFLAIIGAALSLVVGEWLWASILCGVSVLSFFVFAERRFASAKEVYQSLRRIREQAGDGVRIVKPS